MKKIIIAISIVSLFSFKNDEKTFTFNFTEAETGVIINAISASDNISAKQASVLIQKIQHQANDSTLNPNKKIK